MSWLRASALLSLLMVVVALALVYSARRMSHQSAAIINVRWAPGIDDERRQTLERRFCLATLERREGTTSTYLLLDTSKANLRAVVKAPEVEDTHHVDRSAFILASTAERVLVGDVAAQHRHDRLRSAAGLLWRGGAALAVLTLLVAVAQRRLQAVRRGSRHAVVAAGDFIYERIPQVSAEGAALFRIIFGGATVALFALSPIGGSAVPPGPPPADTPWLTWAAGAPFVAWPHLADFINPWLLGSGMLFVVGAFTTAAFTAFALGALAWGSVYAMQAGHHPISAPLVALLCLLPSRWGDALSFDAWRRGHRPTVDPREYGYSVWIPGVVLGIAFAAAAASKLREGGIGWILNGTVKYHFLTDAPSAPVDWALHFALAPSIAVALSFAAVAVETLVLPAALLGPWVVRAAAGLAVIPMLTSFWLFQGVFWPMWWVLLLSFAPWHRVGLRRARADAVGESRSRRLRLRHLQAALLLAAAAQQIVVWTWRREVPPLFSAYDMYSKTYASPTEYPETGGETHWIGAMLEDDTPAACRIGEDEAERLAGLSEPQDAHRLADAIAGCVGQHARVRQVWVERRRPRVDWAAGRYLGTTRIRFGAALEVADSQAR